MKPEDFILLDLEEKWKEHLEMLPTEDKFIGLSRILASMLYKQQQENVYLQRRLDSECIQKYV